MLDLDRQSSFDVIVYCRTFKKVVLRHVIRSLYALSIPASLTSVCTILWKTLGGISSRYRDIVGVHGMVQVAVLLWNRLLVPSYDFTKSYSGVITLTS